MVRVTIMHPDLGIGGAERLVVDAALALIQKGHTVNFITNHHDPQHCFIETKDGTFPVTVVADWFPRTVFGRFAALCAYLRFLLASLYVILCVIPVEHTDVIICDLISLPIFFLRYLSNVKILFYCHFPDQLLSKPGGTLKQIYRAPLNWVEEYTTGLAHEVVVNSNFTKQVFRDTFKSLSHVNVTVLYPSINTKLLDKFKRAASPSLSRNIKEDSVLLLSINRFERKKNIELVINALQVLETMILDDDWKRVHLLIAGGYDPNNEENKEYYVELCNLVEKKQLQDKITFCKSPSDVLKTFYLSNCHCVVYTPSNEHFGIVPLEAMYFENPVIAVNSGGPTESIENGVTGYLSDPLAEDFAFYMSKIICDTGSAKKMGRAGKMRFQTLFSFEQFTEELNKKIENLVPTNKTKSD